MILHYRSNKADIGLASPDFITAASWMLASMIGPPIIKGAKGFEMSRQALQTFEFLLEQAETIDEDTTRKVQPYDDMRAVWDRDSR